MAREVSKVPVSPVKKVNRRYASRYSSSEEPDRLSYSYSCLKSFKKNQHIIKELVSLRQDEHYNEPMFSLSGGRTKPIYEPFYTSKDLECDQIDDYKFGCDENTSEDEQNPTLKYSNPTFKYSNIDLEPDFRDIVDKNLLYKWLRYQFKCVNSLWPFSVPRNSIFSKLANKTRTMKMEVFLSNVDEKTKSRLKRYVSGLDLSLEERCTLCNESLIEIDITPIMSDNNRLQEFLKFIHSIESHSNRGTMNDSRLEEKQMRRVQNQIVEGGVNKQNENDLKKNVCKNVYNSKKTGHKTKTTEPISVECLYFSSGMGDTAESEKGVRIKAKNEAQTSICGKEKKKYFQKINRSTRTCTVNNRPMVRSSSSYIGEIVNRNKFVKKTRFNSSVPAKEQIDCRYNDNEILTKHNIQQGSNRNHCNKLPTYNSKLSRDYVEEESVEHDEVNRCVKLEKTLSCKCLMHLERQDYNRYRNQCLFGKGEGYSLRKYVSVMEKKSKCKVHHFENSPLDIDVKDDSKKSDDKTSWDQKMVTLVNKQTETNRLEEPIVSKSSLSSTTTHQHLTGLQNNFQTNNEKTPGEYHICSRIISKVEENYKNKIKLSRSLSNNTSKTFIKCNSTEGMKSSAETLVYDDYRVIHIKDVEELLGEVSYSGTSCSSSSIESSDISCTNLVANVVDQESTNACFESLNYRPSINSIADGTVSDNLKIKSSVNINSNYSNTNTLRKKENASSNKRFTLDTNKLKSVETNKNSLDSGNENAKLLTCEHQNLKAQYSEKKVDYVKIEHRKNFRRKRTSHSMEVRRRSFVKSKVEREQNSMGENNENPSEKAEGAICVDNNKVNSKIRELENNTRELQSKITELIEQLQHINMVQKGIETNKQNSDVNAQDSICLKIRPKSTNKTRLVINVDDVGKQAKTVLSVQKPHKKYLHFIKPQTIYKSISTIFKKSVENNNCLKQEKVPTNSNENRNLIKDSHEKLSSEKECGFRENNLDSKHSILIEVSPKCSQFNKQRECSIILENLKKLNTELSLQNNEIQTLKEYLYVIKK